MMRQTARGRPALLIPFLIAFGGETPPSDHTDSPEAAPTEVGQDFLERQPWPLWFQLRAGALGFFPTALHPGVSVGTELQLVFDPIYELSIQASVGSVYSPEVLAGGAVDVGLPSRWHTSFGVYVELGIGVGGQVTTIPAPTFAPGEAGVFEPTDSGARATARVQVWAGLGYRADSLGGVRVALLYRETLMAPFAPAVGFAAMVAGELALSVAVPLGAHR